MTTLAERHHYILNKLKKERNINVVDLCKDLQVSTVTIRKDLQVLEDKNLLFRTHGGATLTNPYVNEQPANEKGKLQSTEKVNIGVAAAALLQDNDSVIMASGTTVTEMAKSISARQGLTVITPSLNVAIELLKHPGIDVIQLGGALRKSSASVSGPSAEQALGDFFCSKLFLGVDGIDLEFGLTTTNAMEAQLNRQMIKVSQKTIVLCDSTKFGKRGFGKICGLDEVSQVITDSGVSPHTVKALEGMGISVTIV